MARWPLREGRPSSQWSPWMKTAINAGDDNDCYQCRQKYCCEMTSIIMSGNMKFYIFPNLLQRLLVPANLLTRQIDAYRDWCLFRPLSNLAGCSSEREVKPFVSITIKVEANASYMLLTWALTLDWNGNAHIWKKLPPWAYGIIGIASAMRYKCVSIVAWQNSSRRKAQIIIVRPNPGNM